MRRFQNIRYYVTENTFVALKKKKKKLDFS